MTTRILLVLSALIVAAVALRRPAAPPAFVTASATSPAPSRAGTPRRQAGARAGAPAAIVYVAGAVRRPGLYPIRSGERDADAIGRAGGLSAAADAGAVNLAAHAVDGDEIYVPAVGEPARGRAPSPSAKRRSGRSRRLRAAVPPAGDVDVNAADAPTLARVPGIGAAIASRIVEMRALDGPFASLDELLDVAGMTQARLDRARAFLRSP